MNVGSYRNSILIGSFLTWFVLLTFPILTVVREAWEAVGPVPLYQMLGAGQYLIVAFMLCRSGDRTGRYDNFQTFIIVIICLSVCLQLHGEAALIMTGIAYTIALIAAIASLSLIFTMPTDAVARCLGGAAVVLVAFAVAGMMIFGWPTARQLGPIHPNSLGSAMLTAFIFSQFREGIFFSGVRLACLVVAASVSSRFALIGCLLAFIVFEITFRPFNLKLVLLAVLAAAGFVVFNQQITDVLALDDPARNVSSGFTGRDEEWLASLKAIADNPFGMGFKRPPFESWGHNGYLKILLEFGIVGGGLILAAVVSIVLRAPFEAIADFREGSRLRRLASARAAGLVALSFATFFQPQMFNLGDVHGLSFMLLLFWPGRKSVRQPRLNRRDVRFDYRPMRAPLSSPGDQGDLGRLNRS